MGVLTLAEFTAQAELGNATSGTSCNNDNNSSPSTCPCSANSNSFDPIIAFDQLGMGVLTLAEFTAQAELG